jgi:alkylhydroperoxidase family enzyme
MTTASQIASASAYEDYPSAPRLAPIENSWNPLVWLAAAIYRATVGHATPVYVIFARAPRLILAHLVLMSTSEYGVSLDKRTRALTRVFGSRVNGCIFCDDLETKIALKSRAITQADADALPHYATSERFSERERAVLRYVEELNTTRRASDETFDALRAHLSEREIVELTWLNGVGNYLNLMAKPMGLLPEGKCEIPARGANA